MAGFNDIVFQGWGGMAGIDFGGWKVRVRCLCVIELAGHHLATIQWAANQLDS